MCCWENSIKLFGSFALGATKGARAPSEALTAGI